MLLIISTMLLSVQPQTAGEMPVFGLNATQTHNCPATSRYEASGRDKRKVQPKKLSELPPGDAYFAVYRRIGPCEIPMLVRYGVGGH